MDVKTRTARSFGYEWRRFRVPALEMEDNFRGYFQFFPSDFFRGKRVLEAGSGMGRHTYFLAQSARRVVAMDLGDAIHVTASNVRNKQNVDIVQGDIDYPPFRPGSFDFVCAIGVLHHLEHPEGGLRRLASCLRPGGTLHVYLYWALEGAPGWKRALLTLVTALRRVTVRLPHRLLDPVAWVVAVVGYVLFSVPYRYLSRWKATAFLVADFPLQRYARDGFQVCYNDQFDRLSAPVERRLTREETIQFLEAAGLVDIRIEAHYGWLACGKKTLPSDQVG